MPMKASYYTVSGVIRAQDIAGARLDYLPDAVGSVVATVDQAKTVTYSARYKPYGQSIVETGLSVAFGWAGGWGYKRSSLSCAEYYVRARHYMVREASWQSEDPLTKEFPELKKYVYVNGNPITLVDPLGLMGQPSNILTSSEGVSLEHGANTCLQLTFNLPPIWIFNKLKGRFKVCQQKYNSSCCPKPVASACTQVEFLIVASATLDPSKYIADLTKDMADAYKSIADLIGGFGNLMLGQDPIDGCPKPKEEWSFRLCIGVCLGFQNLKYCFGGQPALTTKTGYCGLPSASLEIGVKYDQCA